MAGIAKILISIYLSYLVIKPQVYGVSLGPTSLIGKSLKIKLQRHVEAPDPHYFSTPVATYHGALGIGTPVKLFDVIFDINSDNTWITYYRSRFSSVINDELNFNDGYEPDDSTTKLYKHQTRAIDYMHTKLECYMYEDIVTLYEDTTKKTALTDITESISFNQGFLVAYKANNKELCHKPFEGAVGLSPKAQDNQGYDSFLLSSFGALQGVKDVISETNMTSPISPLVMGLWFDHSSKDIYGGELIIGGLDTSKITERVSTYHELISRNSWSVNLKAVKFGDQQISYDSGCTATLVAHNDYIRGPRQDVDKIFEQLNASMDPGFQAALIPCDRKDYLPDITFTIDNTEYTISAEDYSRSFAYQNKYLFCYINIRPHDNEEWHLGATFLQRFYTILDYGKHQLSLVKSR